MNSVDVPADVVRLEPLSVKAADSLVRRVAPGLDAERRRAVVAAAEGSPLLLEMFATAAPSLPVDLASLVERWMSELTPRDREWVEVVAVSGVPTSRAVPATIGHLLVPTPDGRRWFVHDTIAEAVRALMPADRRDRALETLLLHVGPIDRPRLLWLLGRADEPYARRRTRSTRRRGPSGWRCCR